MSLSATHSTKKPARPGREPVVNGEPPEPASTAWWGRSAVWGPAVAIVVLVLGLGVPSVVSDSYYVGLVLDGVILALLALGIGFLARHLGLISLGHTAFFGGAAYGVAIANTRWQWGPMPAALFGFAIGLGLAVVIGALVVRATGMGFLMLTLALGQALYQVVVQVDSRPLTGAYDGLIMTFTPDQTFLGETPANLTTAADFWPIAWVSLVVLAFLLWALGRTRFGTLLHGVRENEERMRFSGYNTFAPRFWAFVISGAVASFGGVLFALNAGLVTPDVLSFQTAGQSLIAAIVGGLGTLVGPIIGALLYIYAQSKFSTSGNLELYTGIALILVLAFLRGGIVGTLATGTRRLWSRRARSESEPDGES